MNEIATLILGPLWGPECRRALGRGWLVLVRALGAVSVMGVTSIALWIWWINARLRPEYQPYYELRIGLAIVEGILLVIALVLGPALMAGSLAGEKERGVLALLLTTRVKPREIVTGRLAGKLTQVGMIILAGFPAVTLMAGMAGMEPSILFVLLGLPLAVAVGGGGLAALTSVLSRRGRDALLSVYLIDVFLMLSPLADFLSLPRSAFDWISALNPFIGLQPLVFSEDPGSSLMSIALWLGIGVAGIAVASWRLRPAALSPFGGDQGSNGKVRKCLVPPVDERRPMVWKELFIERVATLGKFGRIAGFLLVLGLIGGSVALSAIMVLGSEYYQRVDWADWARDQLEIWIAGTGTFVACLVQWAIGLRAAVSISSERERGTWDALLTSPLDGGEIVRSKVWGSLYAIRWLIFAAFVAWAIGAMTGAVRLNVAVGWVVDVLVIGAFMAAVGVRTSLASATATRAMSLTIGVWLGAMAVVAVAAGFLLAVGLLVLNAFWMAAGQVGMAPAAFRFWAPVPYWIAWPVTTNSLYLLMTIFLVVDTRVRFDRLAGRITGGSFAVAVDELVHGRQLAPELEGPEGDAYLRGDLPYPPPRRY